MSQNRLLMALIGSVIVGLLAIILSALWLKETQTHKTAKVVSAGQAIAAGTPLTQELLSVIDIPIDSVPLGASGSPEPILGRVTKVNIGAGQVIVDQMLDGLGSDRGLAYAISKGKRAITLNVNEITDVAGFVMPGNYVDILSSPKTNAPGEHAQILLQKVLVLAVAQDRLLTSDSKARVVNAVTVEVTPDEAEIIESARAQGLLSLTLRNQADEDLKHPEGPPPPKEPPKEAPKSSPKKVTTPTQPGVQVIRGTHLSIESGSKP